VQEAVRRALAPGRRPDGAPGLFDFDALDFGTSMHLSDIYAAVQAVPGVRAARVKRFRHHARTPGELDGEIPDVEQNALVRSTEIVRCDADPADPDRGELTVTVVRILPDAGA
jgi:hypothetical protein